MRRLFVRCATAGLLAAAPYFAHAASTPAPQQDEALALGAAGCAQNRGPAAKACDEPEAREPRARDDDARAYADASSTRLRNRAYLRAAASYCGRYSGRVRAACVDEATAIYGP